MTFDNSAQSVKYLVDRGLSETMQSQLGIHWADCKDATTQRYGYGKLSTSRDGLIIFPLQKAEGDRIISVARNFYSNDESKAAHLELINQDRSSKELQPVKRIPKYVLPFGDRSKGRLYDPYSLLHLDSDKPILFATEDVIGAAKAAIRGLRIVSTFGVWLATNSDMKDRQEKDWTHAMAGEFSVFFADSDALEKKSVCAALVRTGFVVGCKIGYFPSGNKSLKVGLDEWLDANPEAKEHDLANFLSSNSADALTWLEELLPSLIRTLEGRGYNPTEAAQIASPVRDGVVNELLKHQDIDDLRASGFYGEVLKPMGLTLDVLRPRERAIKRESGELDFQLPIAELIVKLVADEAVLFHDAENNAYTDVIVDDSRHTYLLKSVDFKRWVSRRIYEEHSSSPNSEGYQAARNTLESMACFDGNELQVWLRTALKDGKFYLDLANDKWQAVEIDTRGWRIVDRPPVRFIRPSTMGALPNPTKNGNLEALKGFLNVDSDSWVLLVTFLLFCFVPNMTYPVLLLAASRGSGKTSVAEFLKSLIDPGKAPLIGLTSDPHRASVAGQRRWLLAYDNVSNINPEQSDLLCRIATGFGFSTRTLFETDGETVFEFKRPQIITAIDHVVTRDDLSDRLLMVQLPPIDPSKRVKKSALDAQLDALRPGILGALLTTLSETLAEQHHTPEENLPRMADFGHFAIAAETALGLAAGEFTRVFDTNREASRQVVLESSPLAEAIQAMVSRDKYFKGTASVLLKQLESFAEESVVRSRWWPKASNTLSRQINRLKPDLEAVGLSIVFSTEGGDRSRLIEISAVEVLNEF